MAPARPNRDRVRTTITLDPRLHDYIRQQIGAGKRFYNLSHAFDTLILEFMDEDRQALELGTLKAELEEIRFTLKTLKEAKSR